MISATSDVLFALSCFILVGFAFTVGRIIAELLFCRQERTNKNNPAGWRDKNNPD